MKVVAEVTSINQFTKAHDTDAGYDIQSIGNYVILPGEKAVIDTGLKLAIEEGYYGLIKSRSGLAVKHDLEVGAGVIDADYRGEIKVVLRNLGKAPYTVNVGAKVAQLIITKLPCVHVEYANVDSDTTRGANGFNSTGY